MFKAKKLGSSKSGFTLIEVVLVLAIGGLIFLLAFIAFGQATKNRRDTQRRSDAARIISEIENAKGDTNGGGFDTGTELGGFIDVYLGGDAVGSTGGTFTSSNIVYTVTYGSSIPGEVTSGTANISVSSRYKCNGNVFSDPTGNSGDYAVVVRLEKGLACRDNQ